MAKATVTRDRHPGALHRVLYARDGAVSQEMYRRGVRVQGAARRFVGVDTGRLRASIDVELYQARGGGWAARVGSNLRYAKVHHDGHGWIYPVRARVLVFTPRGASRPVFARRVRPVAGTKYLTKALPYARG